MGKKTSDGERKSKRAAPVTVVSADSPDAYINRELSWLGFARRVLALVEDTETPLLERVKFAGIMGMLHDEFAMKRLGGLKRQVRKGTQKVSIDGRTPEEELRACREVLLEQVSLLARVLKESVLPGLSAAGMPVLNYGELNKRQQAFLRNYFRESVEPVLTPLAVDASHPFPFISNLGLNLAVQVKEPGRKGSRFVRVKVPSNRPRWVALPDAAGFVPLEQVIAGNLGLMFPKASTVRTFYFRVTRGAEGEAPERTYAGDFSDPFVPGSLISQVTDELKARRFAGVVRLQVGARMPVKQRAWIAEQLGAQPEDVYVTSGLLGLSDLLQFRAEGRADLRDPPHVPVTHPRMRNMAGNDYEAVFDEIRRAPVLLHHPYHDFDTSVLRFLESAAVDPRVLAVKLTIYRTNTGSPIIQTLLEAARRGKQVVVLVEITARFDEAPNIAWCAMLEKEGAHVAYGVEQLKTHVKLALVLREEKDGIRRYVHVGTGNYHTGTARLYEDLGMLSCDPELGADVAMVFNELTGAMPPTAYRKLLVAPQHMRERFIALIRREAENAREGRAAGIRAKMNQLQDPVMIRELYAASEAGVPISLNVRGLCCLRAGVPGLSERIKIYSTLGRFLEHGRIYRFENGGEPLYFIGSADWMRRNLDRRVETIAPVTDRVLQQELEDILDVYEGDNCTAWDMQPDGTYRRRMPGEGEPCRASQQVFTDLAHRSE